MELVTFQSLDALKHLIDKGYLECEEKYIDNKKFGLVYDYIKNKMQEKNLISNNYPLWCWVKCNNSICPPKHKGKKIQGFDVKITFKKKRKDVFITDYIKYSFLLNYTYIPISLKDNNDFNKKLVKYNITTTDLLKYVRKDKYKESRTDFEFLEIIKIVEKSFDRCISEDGNILQGCVSKINLEDVLKIEFLTDENVINGSLNYIHSNGKRKDWKEVYYNNLK
ncbi:MAG: DUF3841 domain-containing protein [Mycoplasmatota bacterium]